MINISLSGADKLIKRLKNIDANIEIQIKDIVEEVTFAIERQAIRNAPGAGDRLALNSSNISRRSQNTQRNDTGIAQLIGSRKENNGFIGVVFVSNRAGNLPIYIEFGTGSSAAGYVPTLPQWAQDIARRYFINGRGTLIKKPYFLPAYFQHSPELYRKLKEMIKKQVK